MRMYDIIAKKRDGNILTENEIRWFINEYTKGNIPDYQAAALLMAIFFIGMNKEETIILTDAMMHSGDTIDLSSFGGKTVDKHSTGGVGDKTTLIVGPVVAALGGCVAKMSGRGLGHTGGTVDKLESINGYRTTLTSDEFKNQVEKIGIAVVGQSGELAPADKRLYALRDVTATVNSIPLIASSIMSKKLAGGTDSIVLDVKLGSGAFMKTEEEAVSLASQMVDIGYGCGKKVSAIITDMSVPLGFAIGNAAEVKEAVSVLKGYGPNDLKEVAVCLAANMLSLCNGWDLKFAEQKVSEVLNNGKAYEKFIEWIAAQGGDISLFDDLDSFATPIFKTEIKSETDGYIQSMDAETLGVAAVLLGAGRTKKEDKIDFTAGITIFKKTGDKVKKGEKIAEIYSSTVNDFAAVKEKVLSAYRIGESETGKNSLIYRVIRK